MSEVLKGRTHDRLRSNHQTRKTVLAHLGVVQTRQHPKGYSPPDRDRSCQSPTWSLPLWIMMDPHWPTNAVDAGHLIQIYRNAPAALSYNHKTDGPYAAKVLA